MSILFKKDTNLYCPNCKDHYLTFNRDMYGHDRVSTADFYQDKGQAPFELQSRMICKKCGIQLTPQNLKLISDLK